MFASQKIRKPTQISDGIKIIREKFLYELRNKIVASVIGKNPIASQIDTNSWSSIGNIASGNGIKSDCDKNISDKPITAAEPRK